MNRHTKLAIILAPFLAIGGYIATDYYAKIQSETERFLKLAPQGECYILKDECKLGNGKFMISLAEKNGAIHLATTHPIDHAVISLVSGSSGTNPNIENEKLYQLKQNKNRLNWTLDTRLTDTPKLDAINTLRLLITIKKTSYLAEINLNP